MKKPRYSNALVNETSPYLLQHAHNPVDWHPWSEAALQKAGTEDKPILLSIGYSACHWCHVMERESFENPAIAALMNELFVNIKVDREERPDLDTIYMQAVQMMTGSGGWPMTVFLTPDQVPFYGGTYFPPEDRQGMPGFPRVLRSVARAYRERKSEIRETGIRIVRELQRANRAPEAPGALSIGLLDDAVRNLLAQYDPNNGGFGSAPKFPSAMPLDFLMRSYHRTLDPSILGAVEETLRRMACGGIYDHLGGGFHRYAVDASWRVPHFEKMLYDNALLSHAYLQAFLLTGGLFYRRIVEETLDYVLREMTSPEGGFYAAQDADSEGEEGRFYTWERQEVLSLLGATNAVPFMKYYGITEEGILDGKNILHTLPAPDLASGRNGPAEIGLLQEIEPCKKALFAAREKRARPARDEKTLAAWNGLMMKSFAEAAATLDRKDYRAAAVRCAEFLLYRMSRDGRLLHSWKDGRGTIEAFLDDYACVGDGFLSLYESTLDARWSLAAIRFAEKIVDQFQEADSVGFSLTSREHESLLVRPADHYDNATPSGNSVAVDFLLRLGKLTGNEDWSRRGLAILETMAGIAVRHPAAFGRLLCALDFAMADVLEISIAGETEDQATQAFLREAWHRYLPNRVIGGGTGEGSFLRRRVQDCGSPAAYVCRRDRCLAPAASPAELARQLE